MHYFTDDWEDSDLYPGTGWQNCETRSYSFEEEDFFMAEDDDVDVDGEARLTETMESRRMRGKLYPMCRREEQQELFQLGMQRWESQGLQRPDRLGLEAALDLTAAV